jgi:outer membrane immunogenic protein
MRKILLSSVALLGLTAGAFAADLPSRKEAPVYIPPPPVFTWTGVYVGGQVGYGFGHDRIGTAAAVTGFSPNGVVGGAHIGYNYQVAQFVFGLEGDVDGASYKGTVVTPAGFTDTTRVAIDGSVRGRVGYAFDRALFYATGGAAFASIQNSYLAPGGAFTSLGHSRVGWTVGGGIEYAITNNWSIRAEYRYTDYGRYTDALAVPVSHHPTDNRVMAGFSYKFDMFGPTPVVAKY